jgi:hypothetical protein
MCYTTPRILLLLLSGFFLACGGSNGPTAPTNPTTTTTAPASPTYQIDVLITVYKHNDSGAFWSRGQTTDGRIGEILLGVDDLSTSLGPTNLNNEGGREELQASIDRLRSDFQDADYQAAFGETKENLERYINDKDNDGWSIDGRNGLGRDWPFDSNGNDPDGWTAQIVVTVTRL